MDGYFADVATAIAGRWLGVWIVLAAAVANIGLFEAEMTSDAFQVMGMVRCDPSAQPLGALSRLLVCWVPLLYILQDRNPVFFSRQP